MVKRKYTFYRFREYETQAFAEFLEMMAARGWFLEDIYNRMCQCFERGEPRKLKFSVVILPPGTDGDSPYREEAVQLRELCEEAGWHLQYGGSLWQVFYSEEENPVPVETDLRLQLKIQKSVSLSFLEVFGGLFPIVIVLGQLRLLLQDPGQRLADLNRVSACVVFIFLWMLVLLRLISIVLWYRKAEKSVERSGQIPAVAFRTVRRRQYLFMIAFVLSLFTIVFTATESFRTRLIWFIAFLAFALVCLLVEIWVERRGGGSTWDRSTASAVGSLILGFVVVALVITGLNRLFPSNSSKDGREYTRLTAFPVEFEELGFQPDDKYYWYSGRTFLAAYQSEDGIRIDEQGKETELRMEYYESPLPAVITKTKSLYPKTWGDSWRITASESFEKDGVSVAGYHCRTGERLEKDIYVISDRNRLLVLEYSGAVEMDEIGPVLEGFGISNE